MSRLPRVLGLVGLLGLFEMAGGAAAAPPPCPLVVATVGVFAENLSGDASVTLNVTGDLVDPALGCLGSATTSYARTFTCTGAGLVRCGEMYLHPGAWVNRLQVTASGSGPQVQAARTVFVAGTPAEVSNFLVWTVYPRTFVVTEATETALRTQLDAAAAYTATSPGPALVTFSASAFPGADSPQTIDLSRGTCTPDPTRHAALCFTGSRVVVDALDANGAAGGVVWSVGTRALSVLRLYGSEDVFRGLVLLGSQDPNPASQQDTVAIVGPAAARDRLEQCIVHGPTMGDATSGQDGAGAASDGASANVIDGCEVTGAMDKGLKVTTGAQVTIRRSCIHDNHNGGVQSTLGGHIVATENLVQHNVPGPAGNGLGAMGSDAAEQSTLATDGNIVRFAGGRGLSVTDNAAAAFRNDYVADNQFVGAKVETTATGPDAVPQVIFDGVAVVCNHNAGISGSCQPGAEGAPCGTDADCCGIAGTCCVNDPGCTAPLHCGALSFSRGMGAVATQADGRAAPVVSFDDGGLSGRNAFVWNSNGPAGANFSLDGPLLAVSAMGNQWEHCGTGATCDIAEVLAQDVRLADGAVVDLGTPDGARAGTPVLARVAPARPRAGALVRVFGDSFNAVEGTACAGETAPVDPCSGDNPAVQQQNQAANANRIRIQTADGTLLQTLYPDAVTPTMLAFRMPFDCFAPLTLQISKRDPDDSRSSASITLCAADGCAGQPAGLPCDDRNACTSDDRCTGGDDGVCAGDVVVCEGDCLTGTCDPASGCVPKAASAPCDDGNACTMGDHCSGGGDACIPGLARSCDGGCATGRCDPVAGCETKPQSTVCRPAAGDCDVAEVCDGLSTECPADGFLGSSTVCRPAAGVCDLAEACTGTSASCPLDRFRPSGTMCRDAAGVCDEPETCSGVSSSCPADAYRPAGAVCRGAEDACDVAEVCSGQSRECPPDGLKTGCDEPACAFERPLACSDPAVPVAITRPFDQARRRVALWALGCARGPSPRPSLLKKAAAQLARARKRIERAANGRRISAGCAGTLQETVDDAARRVQNALGS